MNTVNTPPKQTRTSWLVLSVIIAMALAACGSNATSDVAAEEPFEDLPADSSGDADAAAGGSTFNPVAGSWTLQSLTIEGDMAIDLEGDFTTPTLEVLGTEISGSTSCNTYGGTASYDIAGDTFSVDGLQFTEMGCAEDIEPWFLEALGSVTTFTLDNGELVLTNGAEFPTEMRFTVDLPEENPEEE